MARIRSLKPEFFTSEDIVSLSFPARLLYQGLWCEADREGRMKWRPKSFKLRYLPADDVDIYVLLDELTGSGLVVRYGDGLAYIPRFKSHQHINPREAESVLAAPTDDLIAEHEQRVSDASVTRTLRVSDAQVGKEGKGKEGKGRELETTARACAREVVFPGLDSPAAEDGQTQPEKRVVSKTKKQHKTAIPEPFIVSERVIAWTNAHGYGDTDIAAHVDYFTGYARANGKTYADWDQALINAIRGNWAKLPGGGRGQGAGGPPQRVTSLNGEAAARVIAMMRAKRDAG